MLFLFSIVYLIISIFYFLFQYTSTTDIYTLSLHDALPIYRGTLRPKWSGVYETGSIPGVPARSSATGIDPVSRSEEHTSELQSPDHLVCRLLLEKKKINYYYFDCGNCINLVLLRKTLESYS